VTNLERRVKKPVFEGGRHSLRKGEKKRERGSIGNLLSEKKNTQNPENKIPDGRKKCTAPIVSGTAETGCAGGSKGVHAKVVSEDKGIQASPACKC